MLSTVEARSAAVTGPPQGTESCWRCSACG
jgi:hypothetical protein